jgi:murein L,D-transpeptidase YafK
VRLLLAAILLAVAGYFVWDWFKADSCLDRGGMWAGPMGCRTSLPKVDRILIDKSDRTLTAYENGKPVATMGIALGRDPIGQKEREGDNRTPEGTYPVVMHKADSAYYRALKLGYPTPTQRLQAKASGIDPGDDIMIHGIRNGLGWIGTLHRTTDWTRGCIAVTDGEISWLFQSVPDGTPVEIRA